MRKIKFVTIWILLCYLIGMNHADAQSESYRMNYSKAQKKLKKKADYYFNHSEYFSAQNIYDSLYQFDSISPELNFRLGICALVTNDDISKSTEYFKTASDRGHVEALFYLANWYHLQNDLDKSIELYEK